MLLSKLKAALATGALVVLGTVTLACGGKSGGQPDDESRGSKASATKAEDKPKEGAAPKPVDPKQLVRISPADPDLVPLMRSLLTDRSHYVRRAAIEGLAALGPLSIKAVDDLEDLAAKDPMQSNCVRAKVTVIRVAGASDERVRAL